MPDTRKSDSRIINNSIIVSILDDKTKPNYYNVSGILQPYTGFPPNMPFTFVSVYICITQKYNTNVYCKTKILSIHL